MSETADWPETIASLGRRIARAFERISSALELPARALQFRPAEGVWTIVEIAEHVSLTNHYLLLLVDKIARKVRTRAAQALADPPSLSRFHHLERLATPDFRWESPVHMRPTGKCSVDEIRERLARQQDQVLSLLREFPRGEGALHDIRMSVVGPDERLDLYQFVHFIALHAERHAEQMQRNLLAAASRDDVHT